MASVKFVAVSRGLGGILDYVTNREKTTDSLITGVNCVAQTARDEFEAVKKQFHKVPVYRLFGEPIICGAAGEPMVLAASKEQIFGECKEPAQFAEASRIFFMTTPQKRPEK